VNARIERNKATDEARMKNYITNRPLANMSGGFDDMM
jgi:hypothetical protein